jgi:integrase
MVNSTWPLSRDSNPYEVDGCVFDFHALRHHFITNLVDAGGKPKDVQELARHKTFNLTFDHYFHRRGIKDLAATLDKLPELPKAGEPKPDTGAA